MNNFRISLVLLLVFVSTTSTFAQTQKKQRVFGEVGMGIGKTLFLGGMKQNLGTALGGTFKPGVGNNLMMAFYVAPENWKGFGLGSRIKGTFGSSVEGESDSDSYIFNFYNLSVSGKYFFFTREFNRGLYLRGGLGFGQFTAKRLNDAEKTFIHQYAIGMTGSGSLGYTIALKASSISFELDFESSSRNGTVNQVGDVIFKSGQLGANIVLTF